MVLLFFFLSPENAGKTQIIDRLLHSLLSGRDSPLRFCDSERRVSYSGELSHDVIMMRAEGLNNVVGDV